jgi:hypothetical protein
MGEEEATRDVQWEKVGTRMRQRVETREKRERERRRRKEGETCWESTCDVEGARDKNARLPLKTRFVLYTYIYINLLFMHVI